MNANEYLVTDEMVKDHMKGELEAYPEVYRDSVGEVNMTALAEDAADFYTEYEDGTECQPNDRMFDLAFEVASEEDGEDEPDDEEVEEQDPLVREWLEEEEEDKRNWEYDPYYNPGHLPLNR